MLNYMKNLTVRESETTIPLPKEPVPQIYRTQTTVVDEVQTEYNIPQKSIYSHSLKKLKSYKTIRKNCKMRNMKSAFVNDLKIILNEFPVNNENDMNDELLVEICNIAESYFFYPKKKEDRESIKIECVNELMLPYFRDDKLLLNKTLGYVSHKIKKSSLLMRVVSRLKYFFLVKD